MGNTIQYGSRKTKVPTGSFTMVRNKTKLPESIIKMESKIGDSISKLVSDMIGQYNHQIEGIFTMYLKVLAKPPIKGEITAGKLRWRGITRVIESNSQDTWLEQRGKRISPIVSGDIVLLHSPKRNKDLNQ